MPFCLKILSHCRIEGAERVQFRYQVWIGRPLIGLFNFQGLTQNIFSLFKLVLAEVKRAKIVQYTCSIERNTRRAYDLECLVKKLFCFAIVVAAVMNNSKTVRRLSRNRGITW